MSFYTEFAPFYPQIFPFREEVYRFLQEYAGATGSKLLDAGCGPGFYCGRFALDGYHVAGVDLDAGMIAAAKERFPLAAFHCMDMTAIERFPSSFQMIYSIGNVLAHLSGGQLSLFFAALYEKLAAGGFWVFQVVNWDYFLTLQEYTFPVKSIATGSMEFHRRYSHISPEQVTFEVKMISGGKTIFHEESPLYPLCEEAFLSRLTAAGFSVEGVYGGYDRQPFIKSRSSALVMVCRK
ncbi:class I SAM-dependent methyltransferase [Chlorobium sp. BLA1]|uniref:class I SAM-dependent methyltransferase n=1 Tax=Candidatus Chlorobium masyuteum TaxID=2716876 RepID=UPI00141FEA95|nr:class I SAM-dependent methyltransferase [Candidatus Chlorobium masyuteum]NHQ59758.1 class I SAM-dependent methyltransferase [Candidatus Chlorobium masyuteum]NTU44961.1 class I SAM-dependent methyltransferase [Chlorobiaceae bacterium]